MAGARPDAPDIDAPVHRIMTAGSGWARTSVNAPIFRKDALTSNGTHQYIAWYGDSAQVILARRELGSDDWTSEATGFSGRPRDGHNAIRLMLDCEGYLHFAWDHHVDPLRYARSVAFGKMTFSPPEAMVCWDKEEVTYSEFLALPTGDLLDPDNTSRDVWADSAYRSKACEKELAGLGYRSHINTRARTNHPLSERQIKANHRRSKIRCRIEHVFGDQESMGGKLVRTIGIGRATVKIGLTNFVYNLRRFGFLQRARAAAA